MHMSNSGLLVLVMVQSRRAALKVVSIPRNITYMPDSSLTRVVAPLEWLYLHLLSVALFSGYFYFTLLDKRNGTQTATGTRVKPNPTGHIVTGTAVAAVTVAAVELPAPPGVVTGTAVEDPAAAQKLNVPRMMFWTRPLYMGQQHGILEHFSDQLFAGVKRDGFSTGASHKPKTSARIQEMGAVIWMLSPSEDSTWYCPIGGGVRIRGDKGEEDRAAEIRAHGLNDACSMETRMKRTYMNHDVRAPWFKLTLRDVRSCTLCQCVALEDLGNFSGLLAAAIKNAHEEPEASRFARLSGKKLSCGIRGSIKVLVEVVNAAVRTLPPPVLKNLSHT
ncbi:hypothetical protein C8J57DRAFT_1249487 [Mycena rebaudengoi]|nr:hypothetical protein C8J57DRAFT_1249487 [Mycena rebaudengoi]